MLPLCCEFLLVLTIFSISYGHVYSGLNDKLFPLDSLKNSGALYPLGGGLPSTRVYNSITLVGNYVVIYGGYYIDYSLLDDVQMFDIRSQQWTGPILKPECCNNVADKVETLGYTGSQQLNDIRIGFQGDIPLARAEHGACAVGNIMYMFGGVTLYGYSQDFYYFDPIKLLWYTMNSFDGQIPPKRAGFAMTADGAEKFYLFAGRGMIGHRLVGMNDVWMFDSSHRKWQYLAPAGGISPSSRQHAAAATSGSKLFVFGGIDPVSNVTFNDLWVFDLTAQVWQCLEALTGSTKGFSPPPLFSAHLIPVIPVLPLPIKGMRQNFTVDNRETSFLVYGGVGGGGVCGSNVGCTPLQTTLGQVYKFSVYRSALPTPRLVPLDSGDPAGEQTYTLSNAEWAYARMTGKSLDRGRLVKTFALEQAVYSAERRLLYEFGGVEAITSSMNPAAETVANRPQSVSTTDSASISVQLGSNAGLGGDAVLNEGGILATTLWDLSTGEHLQEVVSAPVNPPWVLQQAFANSQPAANSSVLHFQHQFRIYTVAPSDIVLQQVVTGDGR